MGQIVEACGQGGPGGFPQQPRHAAQQPEQQQQGAQGPQDADERPGPAGGGVRGGRSHLRAFLGSGDADKHSGLTVPGHRERRDADQGEERGVVAVLDIDLEPGAAVTDTD